MRIGTDAGEPGKDWQQVRGDGFAEVFSAGEPDAQHIDFRTVRWLVMRPGEPRAGRVVNLQV